MQRVHEPTTAAECLHPGPGCWHPAITIMYHTTLSTGCLPMFTSTPAACPFTVEYVTLAPLGWQTFQGVQHLHSAHLLNDIILQSVDPSRPQTDV
jgi:hypothetical protein